MVSRLLQGGVPRFALLKGRPLSQRFRLGSRRQVRRRDRYGWLFQWNVIAGRHSGHLDAVCPCPFGFRRAGSTRPGNRVAPSSGHAGFVAAPAFLEFYRLGRADRLDSDHSGLGST